MAPNLTYTAVTTRFYTWSTNSTSVLRVGVGFAGGLANRAFRVQRFEVCWVLVDGNPVLYLSRGAYCRLIDGFTRLLSCCVRVVLRRSI
jgi:hypothetical protein